MRSGIIIYLAVILGILFVIHEEAEASAEAQHAVTIEVVPSGD